ncbi:MAG: putative transport system permease protein [Solirubrobacteraceae bacterium]|nr:putative transport system permease protein [Solirubrobacteraceae bacterium]
MILLWLRGLLARRRTRLAGTVVGVAVCVALIASVGTFLSATTGQMTKRAAARVAVDWQLALEPGTSAADALAEVRRTRGVGRVLAVGYADTTGLAANTGGGSQQTGPGRVLGIPGAYRSAFPGQLRSLDGRDTGVLVAQQTAANLHAAPGDTITIGRRGRSPARVRVDGVVDLPAADSLFQRVGAPLGAQPQAPPDNVVLLPAPMFAELMTPGAQTQLHVKLAHALPRTPGAAFTDISGRARNLETRLAGGGLVGDNLGTALDQARRDALYASLLFLFLGLPGAVIAAFVTASLAALGGEQRRRDAALLRTRGATTARLVGLAGAEAAVSGLMGVALGLAAALLIGHAEFGSATFGGSTLSAVLWASGSVLAGLATTAAAIVVPGWRDARSLTVAGQRRSRARHHGRRRIALALLALAGSGLVFWQASRNGYDLVLAPEGVPQVSVNWYALLSPVLGWIGAGILINELARAVLARDAAVRRLIRPAAGPLSGVVSASLRRRRSALAASVTLLALTAAFGASTAVFNSTYKAQAEVDARLTNGADVTVVDSSGTLRSVPHVAGVGSVEPLQHRFAYVGADLQDLYGVRPATIGPAAKLQDAWFRGGTAAGLMATLAKRPDSVLVSEETVKDFQLHPGDLLRLRIDGQTVAFHYAGVALEFPTAPSDSFLVGNAGYIARATGSNAIGTFLVQPQGASARAVAERLRARLGTQAKVTDIDEQRRVVGSNLTAVELSGLTRVELGFALVLAIAASGLALAVGFRERHRTFVLISALGARPRQLGAFVWSESLYVTLGGLVLGATLAAGVSVLLIKILTGVFDPPPSSLAVPWSYLLAVVAVAVGAVVAADTVTLRALRRPAPDELRAH